jgi:hypothetical protein
MSPRHARDVNGPPGDEQREVLRAVHRDYDMNRHTQSSM